MNNKYTVTISSPLVRDGIVITTQCSEKYLVPVLEKALDLAREFNNSQKERENANNQRR